MANIADGYGQKIFLGKYLRQSYVSLFDKTFPIFTKKLFVLCLQLYAMNLVSFQRLEVTGRLARSVLKIRAPPRTSVRGS